MFCILTQQIDNKSCQNLREEFIKLGHQVCFLEYTSPSVQVEEIKNNEFLIKENGNIVDMTKFCGVVLRSWGTFVLGVKFQRIFEIAGIVPCNHSEIIAISDSKIATAEILKKEDIQSPLTFIFPNGYSTDSQLWNILNYIGETKYYVIKPEFCTGGNNITFASNTEQAFEVMRKYREEPQGFVLQKYIDPPRKQGGNPWHIRALVIENKVIGALKLTATGSSIASNSAQKGVAELIELSDEQQDLAIKASNAIGLSVSGVDIMQDAEGKLYVLEVNDSPKLSTLDSLGVNVSREVALFFVNKVKQSFFQNLPN